MIEKSNLAEYLLFINHATKKSKDLYLVSDGVTLNHEKEGLNSGRGYYL